LRPGTTAGTAVGRAGFMMAGEGGSPAGRGHQDNTVTRLSTTAHPLRVAIRPIPACCADQCARTPRSAYVERTRPRGSAGTNARCRSGPPKDKLSPKVAASALQRRRRLVEARGGSRCHSAFHAAVSVTTSWHPRRARLAPRRAGRRAAPAAAVARHRAVASAQRLAEGLSRQASRRVERQGSRPRCSKAASSIRSRGRKALIQGQLEMPRPAAGPSPGIVSTADCFQLRYCTASRFDLIHRSSTASPASSSAARSSRRRRSHVLGPISISVSRTGTPPTSRSRPSPTSRA